MNKKKKFSSKFIENVLFLTLTHGHVHLAAVLLNTPPLCIYESKAEKLINKARKNEHTDVLDFLEIYVEDSLPDSVLHKACRAGNNKFVRNLLLNGNFHNDKNVYYQSPFDAACSGGHFEIVDMLISQLKQKLDEKEMIFQSNFLNACVLNHIPAVKLYVENDKSCIFSVDEKSGNSGLHLAVKKDSPALIGVLLEFGAELCKKNKEDDAIPLELTYKLGRDDCLGIILRYLRTLDKNNSLAKKIYLEAFHNACASGNLNVVKKLFSDSPDCLNDVTQAGQTPLDVAAKNKHFRLCKLLITRLNLPAAFFPSKCWSTINRYLMFEMASYNH